MVFVVTPPPFSLCECHPPRILADTPSPLKPRAGAACAPLHTHSWTRHLAILGHPAQIRMGFSISGAPIWPFSPFRLRVAQSRLFPDSRIGDSRPSGSESSRLARVDHFSARWGQVFTYNFTAKHPTRCGYPRSKPQLAASRPSRQVYGRGPVSARGRKISRRPAAGFCTQVARREAQDRLSYSAEAATKLREGGSRRCELTPRNVVARCKPLMSRLLRLWAVPGTAVTSRTQRPR